MLEKRLRGRARYKYGKEWRIVQAMFRQAKEATGALRKQKFQRVRRWERLKKFKEGDEGGR